MILYLDTSALVKLYVEEDGSAVVGSWVRDAEAVATVRIAYAEARAAFARHQRDGALTAAHLRRVVTLLDADWGRYSALEVTDALVRNAGRLAERHALRGFDAVHLAAAIELREPGTRVAFGCFDERLNHAARRERLAPLAQP
ncbi:MAG: type II toxin-antitoxin system VapC family toxin [bacterium]